ncbi:MAG TPA: RNA helicase, partial [Catenuloplanes sp.]
LAMMLKAGVQPAELRVRLGDPALGEVTGAREPSGVPVVIEPEPARRSERPRGDRRFGTDRVAGPRRFDSDRSGSGTGSGDRGFGARTAGSGTRATGEHRFGDRPGGFRHDAPRDDRRQGTAERRFGDRRPARTH